MLHLIVWILLTVAAGTCYFLGYLEGLNDKK